MSHWFGGVEAGGTKVVCGIGRGPQELPARVEFPTTTPAETLGRVVSFFKEKDPGTLAGIGVASFGPVEVSPESPRYGVITSTPKPGWQETDLVGTLQRGLGVPVVVDTDVNAAALGEYCWGQGQSLQVFVYLTVGTGIGGGGIFRGRTLHGMSHPEMGHLRVPHDWGKDPYPGCCPFHGDCLEGLASGPALHRRWGQPAEKLPGNHPAWDLEAHYLALGIVNLILTLSPQRVIVGGGVMKQPSLLPRIRSRVQEYLAGYLRQVSILERIEDYLVSPALGDNAGLLGAIALAQQSRGLRPGRSQKGLSMRESQGGRGSGKRKP